MQGEGEKGSEKERSYLYEIQKKSISKEVLKTRYIEIPLTGNEICAHVSCPLFCKHLSRYHICSDLNEQSERF